MKKLFLLIAAVFSAITLSLSSCSDDDGPGNFSGLTPGLYVTTLTSKMEPKAVDKSLYIDKQGGFFMRGVNILPTGTARDTLWTVDSVTWVEIRDSILSCPAPADTISFYDSPWLVAQRFTPSSWLWIERIIPDANPEVRPMVLKFYSATVVYPREIKVYLSAGGYQTVYPVTQFGLIDKFVDVQGRSTNILDLPTVAVSSVRQPDGSFVISRR